MSEPDRTTSLRVLAAPGDVNFGGKVHGGAVMRWIDQAGYACAATWSSSYCVTVYVGGIRFIKPIHVGQLVDLEASVIHTGNTSMHVLVTVRSRDLQQDEMELTTRCIIVFVAMDDEGKPKSVPQWSPHSEEDRRLERYAVKLMEARNALYEELTPFAP